MRSPESEPGQNQKSLCRILGECANIENRDAKIQFLSACSMKTTKPGRITDKTEADISWQQTPIFDKVKDNLCYIYDASNDALLYANTMVVSPNQTNRAFGQKNVPLDSTI